MYTYTALFLLFSICCNYCNAWKINFEKAEYAVHMGGFLEIPFNITADPSDERDSTVKFTSIDENIANFNDKHYLSYTANISEGLFQGILVVQGVFLGRTKLDYYGTRDEFFGDLDIIVIRKERVVDIVFTASVAILVSLLYINFGCALEWRAIIKTPLLAPALGLSTQFVGMPLLAYGIGWALFPNEPAMRLGVLFVGVSPAGGASNVWTCILDGNIELSVTMTTISTMAAFFMMPLWLFTLGRNIFEDAKIAIPYTHIASLAVALVLPLGIGYLLQIRTPNFAKRLARLLKILSALLITYIIIFATATNFYLFKLFSWKILLAGFALPACGYLTGAIIAIIGRRPPRDVIAIAVETGVQNTGIAIFLLRFALPPPQNDLTTVVPVSMAIMTPIPLVVMYFYKRCTRRKNEVAELAFTSD